MNNFFVGLLAFLYIISPIDLITDVIPFIGWLDDIGVLGMAVKYITQNKSN